MTEYISPQNATLKKIFINGNEGSPADFTFFETLELKRFSEQMI